MIERPNVRRPTGKGWEAPDCHCPCGEPIAVVIELPHGQTLNAERLCHGCASWLAQRLLTELSAIPRVGP